MKKLTHTHYAAVVASALLSGVAFAQSGSVDADVNAAASAGETGVNAAGALTGSLNDTGAAAAGSLNGSATTMADGDAAGDMVDDARSETNSVAGNASGEINGAANGDGASGSGSLTASAITRMPERTFTALDTNGDRMISSTEAEASGSVTVNFEASDSNEDSMLDRKEFNELARSFEDDAGNVEDEVGE